MTEVAKVWDSDYVETLWWPRKLLNKMEPNSLEEDLELIWLIAKIKEEEDEKVF